MKTIPIALAAQYALPRTTLAFFLKVVRLDDVVFGLTSANEKVTIDGVTYNPGFDVSTIVSSSGLAVDNLELTILKTDTVLSDADLLAGQWNNASFTLYEANFLSPTDGVNVIKRGTTANAQIKRGVWTMEFLGLKQALQQALGAVTEKNCRAELGDSGCKVNLFYFTFAGEVTAVTSRQVFADSAQTQDDEYFVEGPVYFLTGANAGYGQKVKIFASGVFTLSLAMPFPILVGDTFTAIAGCQKRHERTAANPGGISDCIDKFDNILNFQGEPHVPGTDAMTSLPDIPDS